jgi:hypothetical protein
MILQIMPVMTNIVSQLISVSQCIFCLPSDVGRAYHRCQAYMGGQQKGMRRLFVVCVTLGRDVVRGMLTLPPISSQHEGGASADRRAT